MLNAVFNAGCFDDGENQNQFKFSLSWGKNIRSGFIVHMFFYSKAGGRFALKSSVVDDRHLCGLTMSAVERSDWSRPHHASTTSTPLTTGKSAHQIQDCTDDLRLYA